MVVFFFTRGVSFPRYLGIYNGKSDFALPPPPQTRRPARHLSTSQLTWSTLRRGSAEHVPTVNAPAVQTIPWHHENGPPIY